MSQSLTKPLLLKGTGKINGDGWKDTTVKGEIVYVWNSELPEPYVPGQYPRVGCPSWSASTSQYEFEPVPADQVKTIIENLLWERQQEIFELNEKHQAHVLVNVDPSGVECPEDNAFQTWREGKITGPDGYYPDVAECFDAGRKLGRSEMSIKKANANAMLPGGGLGQCEDGT